MGDHTATCAPRCTRDHRSTAEKLRDVANHPRTPANEAEAARNRLRAMGETTAKPEPKSPYADLFKPFSPAPGEMARQAEEVRRAAERIRKTSEALRREAEAARRATGPFEAFDAEMREAFREGFEEEMYGRYRPPAHMRGDRNQRERDRAEAAKMRNQFKDDMRKARDTAAAEAGAAREDARTRRAKEQAAWLDVDEEGNPIGVRGL